MKTFVLTIIVAAFSTKALEIHWIYCIIIWALCAIFTAVIIIIEMFLIEKLVLTLCIDWDDFTTGVAFMGVITTCPCTICYGAFYLCKTCLWDWLVVIVAIMCSVFYLVEFVMDKCDSKCSVRYLAAWPGIFKILEAFVSCIIFVLVKDYVREPVVIYCVVAYILPFPIIPVVIVMNVMKKARDFLPFSLVRFEMLILLISVLFYITTAIIWPVYTLKDNPRPTPCPPDSCTWNIDFVIAFMTFINLILFVLELVFTFMECCDFKRS
ncbi:myeloid-associated differentiation marker-like protein 2 [Alosa alosa]|uniref:myeloid-associated differentiation marker-like protein 2 n=1 Tax=Alosa alosa TaxID=278164 RepID=UPI0020153614|nr:myeloid-associated differentiation marker-like protein 2 [Alosa alosa]